MILWKWITCLVTPIGKMGAKGKLVEILLFLTRIKYEINIFTVHKIFKPFKKILSHEKMLSSKNAYRISYFKINFSDFKPYYLSKKIILRLLVTHTFFDYLFLIITYYCH